MLKYNVNSRTSICNYRNENTTWVTILHKDFLCHWSRTKRVVSIAFFVFTFYFFFSLVWLWYYYYNVLNGRLDRNWCNNEVVIFWLGGIIFLGKHPKKEIEEICHICKRTIIILFKNRLDVEPVLEINFNSNYL